MQVDLFVLKSTYMLKNFLNFFLPHTCILCGSRKCTHLDLCDDCQKDMPFLQDVCSQCAQPIAYSENIICGKCLNDPPPFTTTIALYSYNNPIDYLITQLKFHNKLLYANILGKLLARKLQLHYQSLPKPSIIIPVPLHVKRLKERGYNQALEIAKPIAKILNIPIDKCSCIRAKNTEMQATLAARNRAVNVKKAFAIRKKLEYKYVAVLDDVVTTGHTITEFCQILRNNGVAKIDVWCCARAHFLL